MKKIVVFIATMIICIAAGSQTIDDLRRFFSYDPSEDLNYRVLNTTDTTQATIFSILYTGGNEMQVTAFLVIPKNKLRRYPAIIFLHGLGQDKNAFLSNALDLATKSFASLLIDDPSSIGRSQMMHYQNYSVPIKDIIIHRQAVLDVRRSIDLLEQHPKIDPDRIAFVGIDYGAWTGAIIAGIENRIPTYILIGCPLQPATDLPNNPDPRIARMINELTTEQISQYQAAMKKMDPVNYLPYHRNSTILFQYSDSDSSISSKDIQRVFQITADPKKMETFKASIPELISFPEAAGLRKKWLFDNL